MANTFICAMLALHFLVAKEAFGSDAVVALNAGEPGVYENNLTIIEYERKGYKFCDANMFGEGLVRMETLTFRKVNEG